MNKLVLISSAALLGLTACTSVQVETQPVAYTATKTLNAHGSSSFTVATYRKANGKRALVKGVPCTFEGDGFKSSFTTPANVISPNLQGRMPVASVTCTLDGVSKSKTIEPYNETTTDTTNSMMAAGAAGGLIGVMIGGAIAAAQNEARDKAQDVYGYPDVTIEFDG